MESTAITQNLPGGSLTLGSKKQDQTLLTRFLRGHLRFSTYTDDAKSYAIGTKCAIGLASQEHILIEYQGLSRKDLTANPVLVLDFVRVVVLKISITVNPSDFAHPSLN
ncbi:hypothetical protein TNIN_189241 [Trichonephila inaurata madagascariensis]|uniref:Uncharacterized protein n=1 Tax=Trichonephila inaurata madagascariensis TaxID=2747483 RepID=A0A8X6WNX6_9ARAC|nr:hypothetical protein TNIN_189241 [Trichonephila inaurata madagascariensis]